MRVKNAALLILCALTLSGGIPGDCKAPAKKAAPAKQGFPKVMTGLDTKVSVQILRCVRAHVHGFGQNQVVAISTQEGRRKSVGSTAV